jgi:hypothetical protein
MKLIDIAVESRKQTINSIRSMLKGRSSDLTRIIKTNNAMIEVLPKDCDRWQKLNNDNTSLLANIEEIDWILDEYIKL